MEASGGPPRLVPDPPAGSHEGHPRARSPAAGVRCRRTLRPPLSRDRPVSRDDLCEPPRGSPTLAGAGADAAGARGGGAGPGPCAWPGSPELLGDQPLDGRATQCSSTGSAWWAGRGSSPSSRLGFTRSATARRRSFVARRSSRQATCTRSPLSSCTRSPARRPTRERSAAQTYGHLTEAPPRPSERRLELGVAFDDVIARGLAKDPADRPASASGLLAEAATALGVDLPARRGSGADARSGAPCSG